MLKKYCYNFLSHNSHLLRRPTTQKFFETKKQQLKTYPCVYVLLMCVNYWVLRVFYNDRTFRVVIRIQNDTKQKFQGSASTSKRDPYLLPYIK